MRRFAPLLVAAAVVGGCAASPADGPRTSLRAQQELDRYLAGKVAGAPQACLPIYRTQDMVVIDEDTVLFRDSSRRVWRTEMQGVCNNLGSPGYALVTRQFGGSSLCRGEIARIIDPRTGVYAGSCSFGDFVPFTTPDGR